MKAHVRRLALLCLALSACSEPSRFEPRPELSAALDGRALGPARAGVTLTKAAGGAALQWRHEAPAAAGPGRALHVGPPSFDASVALDGAHLRFTRSNGPALAIRLRQPAFPIGPGRESEGRILFPAGDGASALVLTPRVDGVKEDILLTAAPPGGALSVEWELQPGADLTLASEKGGVAIRTGAGSTAFWLPAPVVRDANGRAWTSLARFEREGRTLRLEAEGLGTLEYPVSVDPTVVITSSAEFAMDGNDEEGAVRYVDPLGSPLDAVERGPTGAGIGAWAAAASAQLASPRSGHAAVGYGGHIYLTGGASGEPPTAYYGDVLVAPVTGNGTLGTPVAAPSFTPARRWHAAVAYDGFLYIIGGSNPSGSPLADVQVARIDPLSGMLSAFQSTSSLPFPLARHSAVAYGGYLYVSGGTRDGTDIRIEGYAAPIHADGNLGTWVPTTSLPVGLEWHRMLAVRDRLWVFGGCSVMGALPELCASGSVASAVYSAPIAGAGQIGDWMEGGQLPTGRFRHAAFARDGHVYIVGGSNGTSLPAEILVGELGEGGTIGRFVDSAVHMQRDQFALAVDRNYAFAFFGKNELGVETNAAEAASLLVKGGVGPWARSAFPNPDGGRQDAMGVAYAEHFYILGGRNGPQDAGISYPKTALIAPILAEGALDGFSETPELATMGREGGAAFVHDARLYITGGYIGTPSPTYRSDIEAFDLNTNGSLSPAAISITKTFSGRAWHSATVYGNYVYVYGGLASGGTTLSEFQVGKFDSSGNFLSWTRETVKGGGPGPLCAHGAVAYAGWLYIIGGCTNGKYCGSSYRTANVWRIKLNDDGTLGPGWLSVTPLPPMPTVAARAFHGTAVLDGKIWVFGGNGEFINSNVLSVDINSDGSIGQWQSHPELPNVKTRGVAGAHAGTLFSGTGITTDGGTFPLVPNADHAPALSHGRLDFASDRMLLAPRAQHASVAHNGYLYVLGGMTNREMDNVYVASIDGGTVGSWAETMTLTTGRAGHAAFAFRDKMYVAGGTGPSMASTLVQVSTIDADGGLIPPWTPTHAFANPGRSYFATAIDRQTVYALGGESGGSDVSTIEYANVDAGSGALGTWNPSSTSLPHPFAMHCATVYNGLLYVLGGRDTGASIGEVWYAPINRSDHSLGQFTQTTSMQTARHSFGCYAKDGYLYAIGGYSTQGMRALSDVEVAPLLKDGRVGNWVSTSSVGNAPRSGSAVAYADGRLYVTGGHDGNAPLPLTAVGQIRTPTAAARYSRRVDLGQLSSFDSLLLNGLGSRKGTVALSYRVADLDGGWSSRSPEEIVTFGTPIPLTPIPDVRYVWLDLDLDNSRTRTVDGREERDITDITIGYTPTPIRLAVVSQPPAIVAVGEVMSVTVEVQDSSGNRVPGWTGPIHMALSGGPGGVPLGGTVDVDANDGIAIFGDLSVGTAGSGYYLVASSSSGLASATSSNFDVTSGGQHLAFSVQPSDADAGSAIAPPVQVEIQDSFGNRINTSSTVVSMQLALNPGGATLSGTLSATTDGGTATFADLSLDKAASGYKLRASSGTLTPAVSDPFAISPAGAQQLAFSVQPSDANAGSAIAPPVQVEIQDSFGNRINTSSTVVSMRLALNPGGATLSGTLSATTDGGTATFTNLSLNKAASDYALGATSGTLMPAVSGPFAISPAGAQQLAFAVQPTSTTAGVAIPVEVEAYDAFGNLIRDWTGSSVTLDFGVNAGGSTLSGGGPVVASGGRAIFPAVILDKAGNGYTLVAGSGTLGTTQSQPFNISPGAISEFSVTAPASVTACVADAVQVTAVDVYGNTVPGYLGTVTVTSAPSGTFPPAYQYQLGDQGTHAFAFTLSSAGDTTIIATDESDNSGSTLVTVNPGGVATLSLYGFAPPVVAGVAGSLTVEALDACGNLASGYLDTVSFPPLSTDPSALLPAPYTFTAADFGRHSGFSGTLYTAGYQTITVTDTSSRTASLTVTVEPGAASKIRLSATPYQWCDQLLSLQVTDDWDNSVSGVWPLSLDIVSGAAQITSSSFDAGVPSASVGGDTDLDGGATAVVSDLVAESVTATASGSGLAQNAISLDFDAGAMDPYLSTLLLSSTRISHLIPGVFATVRPIDACGRAAPATTAALTVDPPLQAGAIQDNGDTFEFPLMMTACPADLLQPLNVYASIDGEPLLSAPATPRFVGLLPDCAELSPTLSEVLYTTTSTLACWTQDAPTYHLAFTIVPRNDAGFLLPSGQTVTAMEDAPRVLAQTVSESDGGYQVNVGSDRCGSYPLIFTVNGAALSTQPTVQFDCPAVSPQSSLAAAPSIVQLGPSAHATISAAVTDVCGNPAFQRSVSLGASSGSLTGAPATTDDSGGLTAMLTSTASGESVVSGTVDAVAIGSTTVFFELPPTALVPAIAITPANGEARPGAAVLVDITVDNASAYEARSARLWIRGTGLELEAPTSSGSPLPLSDGGTDRWLLPSLATGQQLAIQMPGHITAGGNELAVVRVQAENATGAPASADVEKNVTVLPLSVDVGGCGCGASAGNALGAVALACLVFLRRRRRS